MPKGIREPYQELEGGKGFGGMGGGGGGGGRPPIAERVAQRMAQIEKDAGDPKKIAAGLAGYMAGPVLGTVGTIAGTKILQDRRENQQKEKAEREAAAELKRESRGMKSGGMTASRRADGIAQRGKTRGKMR